MNPESISDYLRLHRPFEDAVTKLFQAAETLDPVDGVNKCFILILQSASDIWGQRGGGSKRCCHGDNNSCCSDDGDEDTTSDIITLDKFKYLLTFNVDISYNNHHAFRVVCDYESSAIALYMIEELAVNTSTLNIDGNICALLQSGRTELLKLVMVPHTDISDSYIYSAFASVKSIEFLVDRGVSIESMLSKVRTMTNSRRNMYCPNPVPQYISDWVMDRLDTVEPDVLSNVLWLLVTYHTPWTDTIETLLDAGAVPEAELLKYVAGLKGDNYVGVFLERFGDKFDKTNEKIMKYAIRADNVEHVRLLIEFGMEVTNDHIDCALGESQWELLDVLLECGIDRHRICRQFYYWNDDAIDFLKRNGIEITDIPTE